MREMFYDANGGRLWIHVEMFGLYFISYTFQMWSSSISEPPILTNPLKYGNNDSPHDDYYPIVNDYNPIESLNNFDRRALEIRFLVKKIEGDDGYRLRVHLLQGEDFANALSLGAEDLDGKLDASIKMESIVIKLKKLV